MVGAASGSATASANEIVHQNPHNHRPEELQRTSAQTALELEDVMGQGKAQDVPISATQRMLAACSGSLFTSLLVTPLDVVRVRLQSQSQVVAPPVVDSPHPTLTSVRHPITSIPFRSSSPLLSIPELGVTTCCREVFWATNTSEACIASPFTTTLSHSCVVEQSTAASRRFEGTWEGLVKIARHEGVTSLWRGLSPTLVQAIPANVIYFTGYDWLRTSPHSPFTLLTGAWIPLLAGGSARAIAATAISPLEMFKIRLQASSSHGFRETLYGIREMVASEGPFSLWRGLGLTLWRDVPFSGIYWFGYETVKDYLRARREAKWEHHPPGLMLPSAYNRKKEDLHAENTFVDAFLAGAVSGAFAALVTTPFDVGKTKRQVAHGNGEEVGAKSLSMPRTLYEIWQKEGPGALWKGTAPRMLKVAPACAIMISSYEVGKKAAMKMNSPRNGEAV